MNGVALAAALYSFPRGVFFDGAGIGYILDAGNAGEFADSIKFKRK